MGGLVAILYGLIMAIEIGGNYAFFFYIKRKIVGNFYTMKPWMNMAQQ